MPRNSLTDCKTQFENTDNQMAGLDFCECIHINGDTLDDCLAGFEKAKQ
jgi:hypothetical protein